jgi:hypothetical protein
VGENFVSSTFPSELRTLLVTGLDLGASPDLDGARPRPAHMPEDVSSSPTAENGVGIAVS